MLDILRYSKSFLSKTSRRLTIEIKAFSLNEFYKNIEALFFFLGFSPRNENVVLRWDVKSEPNWNPSKDRGDVEEVKELVMSFIAINF